MFLRALAELIAPTGCVTCDVSVASNVLFCPTCALTVEKHRASGGEELGRAALHYGGAVTVAIKRFKFHSRPDLIARFAPLLVPLVPPNVDLVVPVPIHPNRLAERGYNQATLLARPVARARGLPFHARALERMRDTPMQSALDRAGRLANLEGAFLARDFKVLEGRSVLLVDDVRTTGSTLEACIRALHEVGARRVIPLVLACSDGRAV